LQKRCRDAEEERGYGPAVATPTKGQKLEPKTGSPAARAKSASTIKNYEQERRKPLLETAAKIAAALGISLEQMMPGDLVKRDKG
jgi:transcriptional regulator with XRE-family HTH domain